jgi:hypothetical protein
VVRDDESVRERISLLILSLFFLLFSSPSPDAFRNRFSSFITLNLPFLFLNYPK